MINNFINFNAIKSIMEEHIYAPPKKETKFIVYKYPLRPGWMIPITLPEDLTVREARKLSAWLETLCLDVSMDEWEERHLKL